MGRFIFAGSLLAFFEFRLNFTKLKKNYIQNLQEVWFILFIFTTLTSHTYKEAFYYPVVICLALYSTVSAIKIMSFILDGKVISKIGIWSYSIYLWQQFFLPLKEWRNIPNFYTSTVSSEHIINIFGINHFILFG